VSDYKDLLLDTVEQFFHEKCTPEVVATAERNGWAPALWEELDQLGITRIGVVGTREEALGVVQLAGRFAAPIPLAETVLASFMEPDLPPGPATVAAGGRAPYGRMAAHIVGADAFEVFPDVNLAGEPLDRVEPAGLDALLPEGALVRSVQIVGALETVLDLTCSYARDRVQFGRPLSRFQVVQAKLAELASEVEEAAAAAGRAVANASPLNIAIAKVRCGTAAGRAAAIAHQLHGAIGVTQEYRLQQFTRRLWSWRDDFGNDTQWAIRLGHEAVRMGPDQAWELTG
jgi:alkylation response protein AidB-like acyl-CoA dehydrogenase